MYTSRMYFDDAIVVRSMLHHRNRAGLFLHPPTIYDSLREAYCFYERKLYGQSTINIMMFIPNSQYIYMPKEWMHGNELKVCV